MRQCTALQFLAYSQLELTYLPKSETSFNPPSEVSYWIDFKCTVNESLDAKELKT